MGHQNVQNFPVIDLAPDKLKPGTERWSSACQQVRDALEEYGCFVVLYDQIPSELKDSLVSSLELLFNLPLETKKKNTSNRPFTGYSGDYPWIPLYEGTAIEEATSLESIKRLSNLMWPHGNEKFSGTIHQYANLLASLEQMVIRMVFEGYGLGEMIESEMDSFTFTLLLNKFRVAGHKETTVGAKAHTDKSFLSILDQNQVNGLEVKLKDDDQWLALDFLPSSFVVIAGDGLVGWSNNRIPTPLHRVTMNGDVTRYSMGLFSYHKGIIQVPEGLIDEDHPRRFRSFDHYIWNAKFL